MSFRTRVEELAVSVATDYKQLRVWLTGSASGTLASLQTTDKSSVIAAINEARTTGGSGTPPDATQTVKGVVELATLAEVATGTDDVRAVTPAGVRQERDAVKAEILGGVGPAYDTLSELLAVAQAAEESSVIADLVTVVGTKANSTDVYTKTEIGNPDTDFSAVYTAAKA